MKAKLIKTENGYGLKDCELIAFVSSRRPEHKHHKLSLKNCQAIERGYDLDELADENTSDCDASGCYPEDYFKQGFQKALEILGDKKFSDVNMEDAYYFGSRKLRGEYLDFIKTFQQTEWDVTFNPEELDAEGRLILKRKL